MSVAATVVVQFGSGADSAALVVVELDGAVNLDADGEEQTAFAPGDQPWFLVHHEASLKVGRVACSAGMVTGGAIVSRTRSQQLQFAVAEEAQELPHLPTGALAWRWYGHNPVVSQDGRRLVVANADLLPAIGEATYSIAARQYRLLPPPLVLAAADSYPILIVIYMEAA